MKRQSFIKLMAAVPALGYSMKMNAISQMTGTLKHSAKMPVLFLGHGSPMNAVAENEFVQGFRQVSSAFEKPKAILVVSAHWETQGTRVTAMENPLTIHDFGGFPRELYEVQYPAPGSPGLAAEVKVMAHPRHIALDDKWGLDHGAWSVIRHMYPDADVPVVQLSLDYHKSPRDHYELAKELRKLRHQGVLIVGSGNIVHNLGLVHWQKLNENYGYDWACEVNNKVKAFIQEGRHDQLIRYDRLGKDFKMAVPTPEHYLPLLYSLALQDAQDEIEIFNDEPVGGSLTMTSVKIG